MLLDLTKLSEDELIELNRHIVERLRFLLLDQESCPTRQLFDRHGRRIRHR